jgi:hypothetical protein
LWYKCGTEYDKISKTIEPFKTTFVQHKFSDF